MKKLSFLLLGVTLSGAIHASSEIEDLNCDTIYKFGKIVMQYRQMGLPITSQLDSNKKSVLPQEILDVELKMIYAAYSSPKFSTHGMQEEATEEFATKYFLECKVK